MQRTLVLVSAVFVTCTCLHVCPPVRSQPPVVVIPESSGWVTPWDPPDIFRARSRTHPARLSNVSIRGFTGPGDSTLVAGAVIGGEGRLPLLVRGIGAGLRIFGVAGTWRTPELRLYRDNRQVSRVATVSANAIATSMFVGAFPLTTIPGPYGTDVAALGETTPGELAAHCVTTAADAGVALMEFYDATPAPTPGSPRFINLSARGRVNAGDGLIVLGFVVAGEGEISLLLRAAGGSLGQFNIPDPLGDPAIALYSGSRLIRTNDNWRSTAHAAQAIQAAESSVGAFSLTSDNDAAMVVTLPAGSYTLQVRGNAGATGSTALAEIYELARITQFDAARATNEIGLDLYRRLAAAQPGRNVVLSPYSIESALALAYAGAEGETRREMARVLRLTDDTAALQSAFATLRFVLDDLAEQSKAVASSRTAAGQPTDPIQWHAANRLFGQADYGFRESFLTLMSEGFVAPLWPLDFRADPQGSRVTINNWVAQQTRDKIRDLIPVGGVTPATRLALVNALYLNAPWHTPFPRTATVPAAFRTATDGTRDVPTMRLKASMGYATGNGATTVTLDYLGGGLQFVIVLPDEGVTPETIAERLTAADCARWANLRDQQAWFEVILSLPKFRIEGLTVNLRSALEALGMPTAFDVPRFSANFDRIAPRRLPDDYLYISDVFHRAFIAVDEQGTEAAAATAVMVVTPVSSAPPTVEVRVDRPFLFAIQHRGSGACLFLGRVTDPR